jgi:hypothetical protein
MLWDLIMALKKRGKYRYGDNQADIRSELLRYSKANEYEAQHFADAVCKCGGKVFGVALDDEAGVAIRICTACKVEHPMGDSADFMDEANPGMCACPCGNEEFEVTVGVSLYQDSEDVKWLYLGFRCPKCGLTAIYGDWKNEYLGYKELLARV